ncbi:MAG: ZIP family metal transporter [Candidatus Dadabacteria bacterium]|nr:ZIP family metal transporter [Candidatus Dadabacteria bacterium]
MLTTSQWIFLITIILVTYAGGYYPLFRREKARQAEGFPLGGAFTAGVFLALSLILMYPSASKLLNKSFPDFDYPIVSVLVLCVFLVLLGLEHIIKNFERKSASTNNQLSNPTIPIIMTVMIAIPSFFLGTALGVSDPSTAVFIWIAIMVHKSSAAFALALKMVRSTLTRNQTLIIFSLFALSTPIGIIFGEDLHDYLSSETLALVKGFILALASGTFLYMATLHDLEHAPLIKSCVTKKGFFIMLCGFTITLLVRLLIGEAHHM